MPANQFGRYVWLVDTFRHYKHLSYKEVSEKWQQSGLSYGEGDELPLRTFHNHRKAIMDIFNIIIELDPDVKGYKYHIVNPHELEGDGLRQCVKIKLWRSHTKDSARTMQTLLKLNLTALK
jgi:hypothetical protein